MSIVAKTAVKERYEYTFIDGMEQHTKEKSQVAKIIKSSEEYGWDEWKKKKSKVCTHVLKVRESAKLCEENTNENVSIEEEWSNALY